MDRKAYWYSVIRYSPDDISGEVLNVGLILHSIESKNAIKYYILEENSSKVRSILNTRIEEATYKSFKDIFEYYLSESVDSITGSVGSLTISSANTANYLEDLYNYFKSKKMCLSEPTFSLSDNENGLFESLFISYVGKKYLPNEDGKEKSVKNVIRKIFEEKKYLNIKVKQDIGLKPVPELPLKINIDFGFKNGVWNYLQATPSITNSSKGTEWFAKTKFLIDSLKDEAKVYLLYRGSIIHEKNETLNIIKYFGSHNERVFSLDMDDKQSMEHLFDKIENEAHSLVEVS